MSTKRTRCFASAVMIRSGSSGVGLDTARRCKKSVDVPNLGETFLRRETEDARHVLQHVGIRCRVGNEFAVKIEPCCGNELSKSLPTRITQSALNPSNYGLRRFSPFRKFSLGQRGPFPRLEKKAGCTLTHPVMIANKLS